MNYYEARQVGIAGFGTGVWHFTRRNDDRYWPVGCTKECTHSTPEEACQHWVEWVVERGTIHARCGWTSCANRHGNDEQGEPITCPNPARTMVALKSDPMSGYTLCDEHASDSAAEALFRLDHQGSFSIVSSW